MNNLDGGYESPASTSGQNRTTTLTSQNTTLPVIFYDDLSYYDLVLSPITVTFTLYMTNGTPDDTGHAYDDTSDLIYISGSWLGWPTWGTDSDVFPASQQMFEVGLSDYYTNSFVIPTGNSIYLDYKYSLNSIDLSTTFGAEVVDVLPNGMLVVQATRQLTFSQQTQLIKLRGPGAPGRCERAEPGAIDGHDRS